MEKLNKIFKWIMVGLIVFSAALCAWGFIVGFDYKNDLPVDALLDWAYIMVGLAIAAVIIVGAVVSFKNNPKSLVKLGIGIAAIAVVCLIVYLVSPGSPAVGILEQPSAGILKLTDTILNLTYVAGALAILAIIVGEISIAVRNKK